MNSTVPNVLVSGLCFGEGPRWRHGQLWFSDMHAQQVLRLDPAHPETMEVVLTIEDDEPSGLGWLPDGDLLIVSMRKRQLLRFDGTHLSLHADLSELASWYCNDMVVDASGRAYVGNFGFDLHNGASPAPAELILVEADGRARIVADQMLFPNGSVITADGKTLIVGESFGRRLTAFDIAADGSLENRRVWAELPDGTAPDGICLDSAGGIWSASPVSPECIRQVEGGTVTHRLELEQFAYACMLDDAANLYVLTSSTSDPELSRQQQPARIEQHAAPYPRAGWP